MRTGNDPEQPAQVQRRTDMPAFYVRKSARMDRTLFQTRNDPCRSRVATSSLAGEASRLCV